MRASPAPQRILACDGASQVLRVLNLSLRSEGYEVLATTSAREALEVASSCSVDAAIIELALPDGDGITLCRRLRALSDIPILFLSALGESEQKIGALRAGADDYITKPFNPQELLARLAAVLRRKRSRTARRLVFKGGLEVDLRGHTVSRDGEELALTPTEFELLAVLAQHPGQLLTHRELAIQVWGESRGERSQALRSHIARLRRKLEPFAGDPANRCIHTELGAGFRFELEPDGSVAEPDLAGSRAPRSLSAAD